MATRQMPRVRFDGQLMTEDAAAKGWGPRELARKTKPAIHQRTVYRFLANDVQTVPTATALAKALGQPVERYILRAREAVA